MAAKKAPARKAPAKKRRLRVSVEKISEVRFFDKDGDEFVFLPSRTYGYAGVYVLSRVPK